LAKLQQVKPGTFLGTQCSAPSQGSHYILVLKFKEGLSRTLNLHFQGPILDGNLQHGQY